MSLGAVLLAGGDSRRFGQDKATLLYRGRTLWQNQLEVLRKLDPVELLISARSDPAWRPSDALFVADIPPARGPLGGLAAALGLTKGTHLLALAIDMPVMNAGYLRSLGEEMEPGCGVLPVLAGRAQPLAGIYPVEAHPDFLAALSGEDFSLQSLTRELVRAKRLRVVRVSPENEGLFRNVNEPADLTGL